MSRFSGALATLGLALGALALGATPAHADVPCSINSFTPKAVNVGIVPVTATFRVSTSGCALQDWSVEGDSFFVYTSAPQETFAPYSNTAAGPEDVIVSAYNADYEARERVFANGFSLRHASVWQTGSFNASPEPVKRGKNIAIKGRLLIADWDNDRWIAYSNRTISVQFRTPTGSYATIKTATTRTDGWISTTVLARQTGNWRLVYAGNILASGATSTVDAVQVTA